VATPRALDKPPARFTFRREDDLPASGNSVGTTQQDLTEGSLMAWVYLIVAGVLETVWAFALKQSAGFTRLTPSVVALATIVGSLAFLSIAMRSLPLGTAYTIWTGIGALGAFVVGIVVLGEAVSVLRVASASLVLVGLVGMKLASAQ